MPNALSRAFGLELEYAYPNETSTEVRAVLRHQARQFERTDAWLNDWDVHPDGGVDGLEVSTPICTWRDWPMLKAVMNHLRPMGRASVEAGFHLHLDTGDFDKWERMRAAALWFQLEPVFLRLVSASRRDAWPCRSLREIVTWEQLRAATMNSTWATYESNTKEHLCYSRFAFVPESRHGTFEIRLHQCTMNPRKVKNWIRLFQAFTTEVKLQSIEGIESLAGRSVTYNFQWVLAMLQRQLPEREAGRTIEYLEGRFATLA